VNRKSFSPLLIAICATFVLLFGCSGDVPTRTTAAPSTWTPEPSTVVVAPLSPTPCPTAVPTPEPTPVPPLLGAVIGIDPGHQYIYDPAQEPIAPGDSRTKQKVAGGARGPRTGALEYEINLAVGLLLRDRLEELGATVHMTRTTNDVNISNRERAEFFNALDVTLAIRLHCNRSDQERARGAFMLIPAEYRTDHFETCQQAADYVIRAYCEKTGIPMCYEDRGGITVRGDQTGFNWCTRPIIGIEMGYLTNEEEELLLADPDFQQTMAQGLCEGILRWYCAGDTSNAVATATSK
jgi:N-acetylmuramoyl-L-alanine amidase